MRAHLPPQPPILVGSRESTAWLFLQLHTELKVFINVRSTKLRTTMENEKDDQRLLDAMTTLRMMSRKSV